MHAHISRALWIFAEYEKVNRSKFYHFMDALLAILKMPENQNRDANPKEYLLHFLREPVWPEAAQKVTLPALWGPHVWQFLFKIVSERPSSDAFATLLYRLVHVLPCSSCAAHFQTLLEKTNLRRRDDLNQLVTHLHDKISERVIAIGKVKPKTPKRSTTRRHRVLGSRTVRPRINRNYQGCGCGI
jgi:hypothetical protein